MTTADRLLRSRAGPTTVGPVRNLFHRTVVLARPKPCSMAEAQHVLDRLVAAGIDAEIVEHEDNGLNMWANTRVGGEVRPDERYVIRVPRRQADIAERI
jgi:hypothetical protein